MSLVSIKTRHPLPPSRPHQPTHLLYSGCDDGHQLPDAAILAVTHRPPTPHWPGAETANVEGGAYCVGAYGGHENDAAAVGLDWYWSTQYVLTP